MTKAVRTISITVYDVTVHAALHETHAPDLAARLWAALPMNSVLAHARFSGEVGYCMLNSLGYQGVLENQVPFITRGMIGAILWERSAELTFGYGMSQPRAYLTARPGDRHPRWDAANGTTCHIATLTGGPLDEFFQIVRDTVHHGARPVQLDRICEEAK